ncbi:hypothetical protein [Peribacillus butanolivorans]|uniref:TIGR03943 family putative permease subunit n=1 Tax=Peribacillus butanolivorans TaxID=421767 RepID=UPI00399CD8C4
MDKTIEFDGITFYGEAVSAKLLSVIRFRVIHCIADSGGGSYPQFITSHSKQLFRISMPKIGIQLKILTILTSIKCMKLLEFIKRRNIISINNGLWT